MRMEMPGAQISMSEAQKIKNEGERLFAMACLEVGCIVYYQIPVGDSNIDFLVVNKKAGTEGKLVEITQENKSDLKRKHIKKGRSGKKVLNTTGTRKLRQIKSMEESGQKWTILFNEEVKNLRRKKNTSTR